MTPLSELSTEVLEHLIEEESDTLDGADIYGVIATVADFLDIHLPAALYSLLLPNQRDEVDAPQTVLDAQESLSRGEVRLIGDLIDNSQSNPSSAYPALMRIALADQELSER